MTETHPRRPAGRRAAHQAQRRNMLAVELPLVGSLTVPPPEQLAYLAGVAGLVALDVLEWPVGLLLAAGHLLAADHSNKILADFGKALEEA